MENLAMELGGVQVEKIWFVIFGIPLLFLCLFLVTYGLSSLAHEQNYSSSSDYLQVNSDSPNFVTRIAVNVSDGFQRIVNVSIANDQPKQSTSAGIVGGFSYVGSTLGSAISSSMITISNTVYGSIMIVGDGTIAGAQFIGRIPGNVIHSVTQVPMAAASIIKPANARVVPVIEPTVKLATATIIPKQPIASPILATTPATQWPIHGVITSGFGEGHHPYQGVHTGMDISDGNGRGTTPIRPFMRGRVIATPYLRYGYGIHVIVDNGNGLQSIYGHMASTAVHVGQEVDLNTVLGYEGATGWATGPHVHLEIKLNGQSVNPLNYIAGKP